VLYDRLLAIAPSPVVALHRAVGVAELVGEGPALDLVDAIALPAYATLHAVRTDLLSRLGRNAEAAAEYEAAPALTDNDVERRFLGSRVLACAGSADRAPQTAREPPASADGSREVREEDSALVRQAGRLVVPAARHGGELLLILLAVVGAEQQLAAAQFHSDVCLRSAAVAAVERGQFVGGSVKGVCGGVRHVLLLLVRCVTEFNNESTGLFRFLPTITPFRCARSRSLHDHGGFGTSPSGGCVPGGCTGPMPELCGRAAREQDGVGGGT
jgi:hypothetical protein